MSNKESQVTDEKVVITSDDIRNTRDFFKHFQIPISVELEEQCEVFLKNPEKYSIEEQQKFKEALCAAMYQADHPLLKDPLFEKVIERCGKVFFEAQFTKDIESALKTDE